jgi:site-specific DNA-methyltransferase (adenine-specific)
MNYTILQGDNRQTLKSIPDNSIDAIVTDPPYGIDFLGKSWDANTGALETYQECLRVLKPGGHILAFSAARTYHHLAITLEQAGFEIRDQIMWIYSSGFPKSQDVGKSIERSEKKRANAKSGDKWENADGGTGVNTTTCRTCNKNNVMIGSFFKCDNEVCDMRERLRPADNAWAGWGTALKPAHEPIALARKPIKLSIAKNCQIYGVGALNIDATRIPYADDKDKDSAKGFGDYENLNRNGGPTFRDDKPKPGKMGRDPRNNLKSNGVASDIPYTEQDWIPSDAGRFPSNVVGEIEGYQKYFYCPKVSRKERHIGYETPPAMFGDVQGAYGPDGNRMAVGSDNRCKVIDNLAMLSAMNGYFCDQDGQPLPKQTDQGKNIYLPHKGMIFAHGLKHEYAEWCKNNNKDQGNVGNNHPTVKPVELMKYLIKLITPPGGTVLDPFNGSGSTGMAAVELGHPYIGCELDPNYVAIAKTRIEAWYAAHYNPATELFE